MSPWQQGREAVSRLIEVGVLERAPFNEDYAPKLIAEARQHLVSAKTLEDSDLIGSYVLAYDAARKALTAFLAVQRLRPTTRGGHIVLADVAKEQLDPPLGAQVDSFKRMRAQRNVIEYKSFDVPGLSLETVQDDQVKARAIVDMVEKLLVTMPVF